jgi:hypothetical protein
MDDEFKRFYVDTDWNRWGFGFGGHYEPKARLGRWGLWINVGPFAFSAFSKDEQP